MKHLKRHLADPLQSFFLIGPRGTGKSTWLAKNLPNALVFDLLDATTFRQLSARPERLAESVAGAPDAKVVVIDEVQRIPELLNEVHRLIEAGVNARFVLTGSSARKLRRAGTNLLGGRALERTLHPFMASELGDRFDLDQALLFGTLPVVLSDDAPNERLAGYASLYLEQEVKAEGMARRIGDFSRFLEALSFSHAGILTITDVARECEVSRTTVDGFVGIVEDLLLGSRLPVFSRRAKRRLIKHRKFYFFDAGVYRSLRPTGPLDRAEEVHGGALEGLLFSHLRAWCDYSPGKYRLHFWRTPAGLEVDFVVYGKHEFAAVEVKNAADVRRKDLRGLRAFGEDYPEAKRLLVYRGKRRLAIDGILCLPVTEFLLGLVPGEPLPSHTLH